MCVIMFAVMYSNILFPKNNGQPLLTIIPPNPDQIITLKVGPAMYDFLSFGSEFSAWNGTITSVNVYICDIPVDDADDERSEDEIGETLNLRLNGVLILNSLSTREFPSLVNIDLSAMCAQIAKIQSRDIISAEFTCESNAYRHFTIGIGIHED
jgi:hypothetical protein